MLRAVPDGGERVSDETLDFFELWRNAGRRPEPEQRPPATVHPIRAEDATRYATRALEAECSALAAMSPDSGRNSKLNEAAYSLGQLVAAGHIDETTVRTNLESAARASGLPQHEIDTVLRDREDGALSRGAQTPRVVPERSALPVTVLREGDVPNWRIPDPLDADVPPFPTHVFGWLEPAVIALSDELQTPPDLVSMLLLAAVAAAVRGRIRVRIAPGWDEPLNIYVAVVLSAGETKSPALARVTKPLRDIEGVLIERAKPVIAETAQRRRMQEKRVRQAEDRAVKATGHERYAMEAEAAEEQARLDELPQPAIPRLLVGDITPEGLVRLLAEQGGALASLTSEGGLFDTFANGRYSGGLANLDAILQAHDGREPILVDRKSGDPLRVERPCLTLGLAVQPQVLESIGTNDVAAGRGFLARWLYAVPQSRVGTRRVERGPSDPAIEDIDRAVRAVFALAGDPEGVTHSDQPRGGVGRKDTSEGGCEGFEGVALKDDFRLSPLSLTTHSNYRKALEPRRHPDLGDLAGMVAWANKIDGQLARLAGLLHLIDLSEALYTRLTPSKPSQPPSDVLQVPDSAMRRACCVADYLIEHARAAHILMAGGASRSAERQLLGWLADRNLGDFTVRDAHQALRDRVIFYEVEAVRDAAEGLACRGWLMPVEQPRSPKGGRPPSPRYLVHPSVGGLL